jgi:hypothetical protein
VTTLPLSAALATTGVSAGTYAGITVNTKGLVTSATPQTTLLGYGITDAVKNFASTPGIFTGQTSSRPTPGTAGRLFFATDTSAIWTDTVSAWQLFQPAISGDVNISTGGTSNPPLAANLSTTGVTAGTYAGIVFDAKGRAQSGTVALTTLAGYGITNGVTNALNSPSIAADIFSNRPSPTLAGRLFVTTDTNAIYRDTGSSWQPLPGFVQLNNGAVGSPSLIFANSAGATGLYAPVANTFAAVASGIEVLRFVTTASGVNGLQMTPAVTGSPPTLGTIGSDSNINLSLSTTGAASGVVINGDGVNPYGGHRNYLQNPVFSVWTNGTSFTTPSSTSATASNWFVQYDGTIGTFTISQQVFTLGQTAVPGEPRFFYQWNQTAAGSGSTFRQIYQPVINSTNLNASAGVRTFAGQKVTASFWAQADATRSVAVMVQQVFGTGGSPSPLVNTLSANFSVTTSWQQFTYTVTLPSISGKTIGTNNDDVLNFIIAVPINVTMTIDIANVQFEKGGIATFMDRSGLTANAALYSDLAERYAADHPYEPGTVVVFGGENEITITNEMADVSVAGVISTSPAITMNTGAGHDRTHPFVALKGRVPCKVIGKVRKGDLMVTSNIPGHAMSVGRENLRVAVFGKALQDFDGGKGVIEVAVI